MKSYTTRDVAELLGMTERQVRAHARAGYLAPGRGPRRAYRFSFQDLVLLRAAKGLAEARIPARRIRRNLRSLVRQLPSGRPLSEVRIAADGKRIVVRDGHTAWNPDSGQVQLDFAVADLAARVAPLARRAAREALRSGTEMDAGAWYDLGVDLEVTAPDQAMSAYVRALTLDADHADARVNLGRLLQERGKVAEAVAQYKTALSAEPNHLTAAFNLGTALEDLGRLEDAIRAYRKAVGMDPDFADAHFNLSRLYDRTGMGAAAIRHLRMYKDLKERHGAVAVK